MRTERRIIAGSLVGGLCIWIVGTFLDYQSSRGGTLWGAFVGDVPPGELCQRSFAILCFVAIGVLLSRVFARRRRAEEALRASEAKYRALFEESMDAIYVTSREGQFLDINGAGLDMFGYTREEMAAVNAVELYVDPADRPRFQKAVEEKGEVKDYEVRLCKKDGTEMDCLLTSIVRRAEDGSILGYQGVIRDITERKRAEEALRRSEELFRLLVETAFDGVNICEFDPATLKRRLIFCNDRYVEISGFTREVLENADDLNELVVQECSEEERRHHRDCILKGVPFTGTASWKRPDGKENSYEWTAVSVKRGDRYHIIGIDRDITERRRAERAVHDARAYAESIVETVREPLVVLDAELRVISANSSFYRAFKVTPPETEGRLLYELGNRQWDIPRMRELLEEILPKNTSFEDFEVEHDFPHIGRRTMLLNARRIYKEANKTEMILLGIEDVTERRRAEEDRRLLDAKAQQTQRLESLGMLAGGIAHDFNNLLTGVLGYASLALMQLPPESPARELIQRVQSSAQRAGELCKQMLAYSGRGHMVIEPLDLSRLVEEMGYLLEAVISKNVVVKYELAENLPAVEGDATQLRQVVMNLITNASQAIGGRSGVITMRTGLMDVDHAYLLRTIADEDLREGRYVYLEVSDTGCGMDKETVEQMFVPFFSTKAAGAGLGLAAALGIVRSHRGAIKVYSEPGRGTTIKVLLPTLGRPVEQGEDAEGAASTEWKGTGTVLVVDDEETVRAVAKMALESFGFSVLTAEDGPEGIELLREHADEVALVLLDLTMPHINGEQTFTEMRRVRGDLRVILMSGYTEQDAVERFAGKGLVGFVQKPFEPAELAVMVRDALEEGK